MNNRPKTAALIETNAKSNKSAFLAASRMSFVSEEAMIAFSDIMFALGELNERARNTLLERFLIWESLVDEDSAETKRLFRQMIDDQILAWAADSAQ